MNILLYDNWERKLRPFTPLHDTSVGMYCCGPTVYNYAHIGNLRTYLFEDILRRTLEFNGYVVRHVVNITDVGHLVSDADEGEDKMERQSRRVGESAWQIAKRFTQAFVQDLDRLNIRQPTLALDKLREKFHGWPDGGQVASGYLKRFVDEINHDLNMPRALALVWELAKSTLPENVKKATLRQQIESQGYLIEDGPEEARLKRK